MTYKTYLIFGAPGSGKGTQGKCLGAIPRFFHFACGDVFRSLDTRTPLGQAFLEYSSRGQLVPDELTIKLWQARIDNMMEARLFKPDIDALVLDGIPRNVRQAELLGQKARVAKVFHLFCSDRAALISRLKKRAIKDNRLDDASEKVIRQRLASYETETKPVLEYYDPAIVHRVNAMQSPAKVLSDILKEIVVE